MTQLNFCFKGSRAYVQGPDIVTALYKHLANPEITDIDLKFNGITHTDLDLVDGCEAENAKVNIRLTDDGVEKQFQLIENGQAIDCRYEYDEDQIIEACVIDLETQSIRLNRTTGYTLCENFVAMNKYLLQSLFPEEKGKWYFTRLEQARLMNDELLISVKLIKNFNFRLTKSEVFLGDEVIGSVYFTMVKG